MTIHQIVRNTVERLKNEGKTWTPDVYAEVFCAEAKKAGVAVEDCSGVERYTALLDKKTAEEIKLYRVKTTAELIRFLISKMSRLNPTEASALVEMLSSLAKQMAKSVEMLHNAEAAALARDEIAVIDELLIGEDHRVARNLERTGEFPARRRGRTGRQHAAQYGVHHGNSDLRLQGTRVGTAHVEQSFP